MTEELLKTLWRYWAVAAGVPEGELDQWIADPDRIWHCIFCGEHGSLECHFTAESDLPDPENYHVAPTMAICPKCREYKGIEPCVPKHCSWGGEE